MSTRPWSAGWPTSRILVACAAALFVEGARASAPPQGGGPSCGEERSTLRSPGAVEQFASSISFHGERALIGSPRGNANHGAAHVYERGPGGWSLQADLSASDGGNLERFGTGVWLEGDRALVGAPWNDAVALESGAVYAFERVGGAWTETAKLTASNGGFEDNLGRSIDGDGDRAVVGAPDDYPIAGATTGRAYVFLHDGTGWVEEAELVSPAPMTLDGFGAAVAIEGDRIVVGAPHALNDPGRVFVYRRVGGSWSLEASLSGPRYFGRSVALDGDTLVVGAPGWPAGFGSAHVFVLEGGAWTLQEQLLVDDPTPNGLTRALGTSVAVEGDIAFVGAPGDWPDSGAVYAFVREGARWTRWRPLRVSDSTPVQFLGAACALAGDTLLVCAPGFAGSPGGAFDFAAPPRAGATYCTCPMGPCGNPDPAAGCANSTRTGASLIAWGRTNPDEVALVAFDLPPGQPALFLEGRDAVALPYGDGIACTRTGVLRLWAAPRETGPDGALRYDPCAGDLPISQATGVQPGSGEVRRYQLLFRDRFGPCTSGFNLTSGCEIVW